MEVERQKPAWLPPSAIALAYELPLATVEKALASGAIEARKVGRVTMISIDSFNAYIGKQAKPEPRKEKSL